MATRYWVGGSGTWDTTTTTHWASTSGGAGGASAPTTADDVIVDANSGATPTITMGSAVSCQSFDSTNAPAGTTLTWNGANVPLAVGSASGGKFIVGVNVTLTGYTNTNTQLIFVATSTNGGAGWPITSNGKTFPGLAFNGVGGKWQLQDNLNWNQGAGNGALALNGGEFDPNGKTLNGGNFSCNGSTARRLHMGTSVWNLAASGTPWNLLSPTNLDWDPGTSTINCIGMNSTVSSFTPAGLTYYTVNLTVMTAVTSLFANAGTYTNLSIVGSAIKTASAGLPASVQTITGTLTLGGNSVQGVNRLLLQSTSIGIQRSIACSGATVAINSDVDFMDVAIAGNPTWSNPSNAYVGDCGGNSGITATPSAAQTWSGTSGGNWSANAWSGRVPLPQDDVSIASAFVASQTVTTDMPRLGRNIDWTGATGAPQWQISGTIGPWVFGNVTLVSGLRSGVGFTFTLAGRGSQTWTSHGVPWWNATIVSAPGGTYKYMDAYSQFNGALTVNSGTIDMNNQSFTFRQVQFLGTSAVLNAPAVVTISNPAGQLLWGTSTGVAADFSNTTIVISAPFTVNAQFTGGGKTYGGLTYTVANSPGTLQVQDGNNQFGTLNVGPGRQLQLLSATTNTVTNFNVSGQNNGYLYLPGVGNNYVSTPDSPALSITGDFDVRVQVAMTTWTPAAETELVGKWTSSGSQRSFQLNLRTTGALSLYLSNDGVASTFVTSSVVVPFAAGVLGWARATYQASTRQVTFYTSTDGVTWTQLGTVQTSTMSNIFDSTAVLTVGGFSDANGAAYAVGSFYRAQLYSGIAGTLVFDTNFATKPFGANTFIESSSNSATVTINGALAQVGDGRVAVFSSSSGTQATISKPSGVMYTAYLTMQDIAATGAQWYALNSVDDGNNTGWTFNTVYQASSVGGISISGSSLTPVANYPGSSTGVVAVNGGAAAAPVYSAGATGQVSLVGAPTAVPVYAGRSTAGQVSLGGSTYIQVSYANALGEISLSGTSVGVPIYLPTGIRRMSRALRIMERA